MSISTQSVVVGICILMVLYIVYCAYVYLTQRRFVYRPKTGAPAIPSKLVAIKSGRAELKVSTEPVSGSSRALLYFGGNAEDVSKNLSIFSALYPHRSQFLMHYRGYGGSTGKPSERALLADAVALYDHVGEHHDDVIVIGRGLGSAVAVNVASQRAVSSLVLITPFDSLLRVLKRQFSIVPISLLLKDRFEANRWAEKVTAPTLLIAAEQDQVIPLVRTQALHKAFSPGLARLEVLKKTNHRNLYETEEFSSLLRSIRIEPVFAGENVTGQKR